MSLGIQLLTFWPSLCINLKLQELQSLDILPLLHHEDTDNRGGSHGVPGHHDCWHRHDGFLHSRHGLIYFIDTKAKCRHLKNWPVKGLCSRCLLEFIDLRCRHSCRSYFRPSFVNCCFHPLLSGSTLGPSPLPCESILYFCIQCVREGCMGFWASDR